MLSFFFFDPIYFLYVGPFFLLAMWASMRVKGTFARYSKEPLRSGVTGAEAAQHILRAAGIDDVKLQAVDGMLSDHYNPLTKTVCLSREVLNERSQAAVAVAAHEVGHAIQHAQGYAPLAWRSSLVPVVGLINKLAMPMFMIGFFIAGFKFLSLVGLIFYGAATLFHFVTLPVEFDASRRAIKILEGCGFVTQSEMVGVRKTLNAAGFTYVAATLVALAQLVYWLLRSGMLGSRD